MTDEEVIEANLERLKPHIPLIREKVFDLLGVTASPDNPNQFRIPLRNFLPVNHG